MARVHPFEERAADVQAQPDAGMALDGLDKREIRLLEAVFKYVFEVPYGLVRVDKE
jgi:hypothetical protein